MRRSISQKRNLKLDGGRKHHLEKRHFRSMISKAYVSNITDFLTKHELFIDCN